MVFVYSCTQLYFNYSIFLFFYFPGTTFPGDKQIRPWDKASYSSSWSPPLVVQITLHKRAPRGNGVGTLDTNRHSTLNYLIHIIINN